jgi:putative NADH-flavin reductase
MSPKRPARPSRTTATRATPKRRGATGARAAKKLAGRAGKAPAKAVRKAKKAAGKARKAATKKAAPKKAAKSSKRAAPKKAAKPRKAVVQFTEAPRSGRRLRIALFGASGRLGSRIAEEALARGHHVTALVRNPDQMASIHPELRVVRGDVTDPVQVEVAARNHDVVASAISPPEEDPGVLVEAAQSLLSGVRSTGKRVVVVGGAGSLEVAPGLQLLDSPGFPLDWRPVAAAHRSALEAFRKEGGEGWTVLSPSALIEPGKRTGRFRWGTDGLLKDAKGESRISMEDYAVAFVDEIEAAQNLGKRITVGY